MPARQAGCPDAVAVGDALAERAVGRGHAGSIGQAAGDRSLSA
jgi:hypothetical protein